MTELEKKYSIDFNTTEAEENLTKINNENYFINLRDITYLDTQHLRKNVFYRSATLSRYTGSEELEKFLSDKKIKTIIDLRSENEPDYTPYKNISKEVNVIKIPIEPKRTNDVTQLNYSDPDKKEKFYEEMLRFHQEEIKEVFETLATQEPGFVVHCYAGKDRTGIITALVLDLLKEKSNQLADELIEEDYINSGHNTNPNNFRIYKATLKEFGGSKRYLQRIGVSNESIKNLIRKFTVQ